MDEWLSYRLGDFIPVTPEVYWRLLERINETFWPLHLLTVAVGMTALLMALRGRARITLLLLAPAWLSSGIIFHFNYYAELNWAAPWFGWVFVVQAGLLLALAAFGAGAQPARPPERVQTLIGSAIGTIGIVVYPLIPIIAGNDWQQAETFALHADPTAVATLGVTLVALRGARAWLVLPIPLLWCLLATLTLIPLEAPWALLPLAAAIATLLALVGSMFTTNKHRAPSDPLPPS